MDNKEYFNELFEELEPKLKFPLDAGVDNTWNVYKPSFFTQVLSSEQNRTIYAEAFDFSTEQRVDSLKMLVLQYLLKVYKGGAFNEKVELEDKIWIGERIDIEMPVEDAVDLDNEVYWKRVALKKCANSVRLSQSLRDKYFDWKPLAIESKLVEIFENTKKTMWNEEKITAIAKACRSYVFQLEVRQLMAIDDMYLELNRHNQLYKIFNYPPRDCHHGGFGAAVGELCNLVSLSLRFGIQYLEFKFHKRYFEMSYEDIAALANGLNRLPNLKHLQMCNNRLDDRKCKMLVRGFLNCPLESLDLSYCNLGDNAGKALAYYLLHGRGTLKSLELGDNRIAQTGWQAIGFGLQNYTGELEYLGMTANPVGEAGVVAVGGGMCGLEQIRRLNMSRIEIDGEGPFRLVQMVGFHRRLKSLDLSSVQLGEYLGDKLIDMVLEHWELEELNVRNCGLTHNQERKLRLLMERNTFYIKNPCMKKDTFTLEDAKRIDDWIVEIKNPILKSILEQDAETNYCEYEPVKRVPGTQIPTFIPQSQRIIPSNSELLNTYYIDCFGTDSDMYLYDPSKHTEKAEEGLDVDEDEEFHYEPNEFDQEQFLSGVLLGTPVDLQSPQYFSK